MTTAPATVEPDLPATREEAIALARKIGLIAMPHAARHDREASFVVEGYEAIKGTRFGAMAVPKELGGGGHDLLTVCRAQAALARFCANTALAIAMHQHNVLTLAWRWRMGDEGVEHTLRRIADGLIVSSTGSSDRQNPGVNGTRTRGGLIVTGKKHFCSGAPGADVVVTFASIEDERRLATVLVPASDPGFRVIPEWDSMGMRGSGSNPVSFSNVFVPDANILDLGPLQRRRRVGNHRGGVHGEPGGSNDSTRIPGLQIALTVISAVYLGAASAVHDQVVRMAASGPTADDPSKQRIVGLLAVEKRTAWWALNALAAATNDDALGTEDHFVTTMLAKREIVLSSIRMVELGMELLGTKSYLRSMPIEQALRDVRAGITHPLAPETTLIEVGKSILNSFGEN
jgi:alkylation response protein AidB-like acyl-CoA dehydrogenase